MKKSKDKLFEKIIQKDYNNKLEEVLSEKNFDEIAKNLLLDIFYKIEASYKDYSRVKINVLSKEEYIQNLMNIIQECNEIKIIDYNSKEKGLEENRTFSIDREKMKITVYPIERKLLYSLAKIHKKENIVREKDELINVSLTNMLNIGNSINMVEPLRDFNGFSWNIIEKDIENKYYNLVYQNLLILVDNVMFEKWTNNNNIDLNYLEIFKDVLKELYGDEITEKIIEILFKVSVLLEMKFNSSIIQNFKQKREELKTLYMKMEDRELYLNELTEDNKKMTRRIRKIDSIVNNKALLKDEYEKKNNELPLEKKIFSMRVLIDMLKQEREVLLKKIEENNKSMRPEVYIEKNKKLKEKLEFYNLLEVKELEKEIISVIIELQKYIIKVFKIKIENAQDEEELIEILYELRYYTLIPIDDGKNVGESEALKKYIEEIEKQVIDKAISLKVITEVAKTKENNFEILRNIFTLKIIRLEDINFKIQKEKNDFFIQFFDNKINDEKIKIEESINKKDLNIKLNKKTKIFL